MIEAVRPELLLVAPTEAQVRGCAEDPAPDALLIDFERRGKRARQAGFDTEINRQSDADLRVALAQRRVPVYARIDPWSTRSAAAIEALLDVGVTGLMLPMARTIAQVERFLRAVDRRARTIVQLETSALCTAASELRALDWDVLYLGLNDLTIERAAPSIFSPLIDGTLDHLEAALAPRTFGFGGVTLPNAGSPLLSLWLMAEMLARRCSLTVLRRSFRRDTGADSLARGIAQVHSGFEFLTQQPAEISALRERLRERIRALER
jgi:hypothetical protein